MGIRYCDLVGADWPHRDNHRHRRPRESNHCAPACNRRTGAMPGDPKEARVHAANCMKLAEAASSPTVQQTFLDLARQWTRLANEPDDAYALLNALNALELKPASGNDTLPNDGEPSSRFATGTPDPHCGLNYCRQPRLRLSPGSLHWLPQSALAC
jgi:hypothetical protein